MRQYWTGIAKAADHKLADFGMSVLGRARTTSKVGEFLSYAESGAGAQRNQAVISSMDSASSSFGVAAEDALAVFFAMTSKRRA